MWLQHGAHSQGFSFLRVPHGHHKRSPGSRSFSAKMLSCHCTLVSAYIYLCTQPDLHPRTPQTFSSFTAGCLLVRAWLWFPAPGISKRGLVIISPSLLCGAGVLSFCAGTISHQGPIVSFGCWGNLTAHHSCLSCCQANNSILMVHNISGSRSAR